MKTQIVKLSKTAGWITLILGTIHLCATIMMIKEITTPDDTFQKTFLFMFVATGLGCLLSGSNMLQSTAQSIRDSSASNHLFLLSSLFMLLLGIGAPIAMRDNPFSYLTLLIGVFAIAVAILRYRN